MLRGRHGNGVGVGACVPFCVSRKGRTTVIQARRQWTSTVDAVDVPGSNPGKGENYLLLLKRNY